MSRTLVMRATSLAASTGLLALAIAGALSVTYTVQQIMRQDTPTITIFDDPPVAPPPPIARPKAPPPIEQHDHVDTSVPPTPSNDAAKPTETSFEPPAPPGPPTITDPRWLQMPSDLSRYYPPRAEQAEVEGSATLDCTVATTGRLSCVVVSETPANWGFGRAALRISQDYRMAPALRDGQPVEARYRMEVPFQLH